MRKINKVSQERRREIVNRYLSGVSSYQLSQETGHDPSDIVDWIREAGSEVRGRGESRRATQARAVLIDNGTKKICSACKEPKSLNNFRPSANATGGVSYRCIECVSKAKKAKYAENPAPYKERQSRLRKEKPEVFRGYELMKKFRMTLEQHEQMFDNQGRVCAGCESEDSGEPNRRWHTDHDPSCCPTGRKTCGNCVRGILCRWCNMALGNAKNSVERLRGLANYLENYAPQGAEPKGQLAPMVSAQFPPDPLMMEVPGYITKSSCCLSPALTALVSVSSQFA